MRRSVTSSSSIPRPGGFAEDVISRPTRPALVAAFAAIYLFWGGTFLAIRWAVADVPPLLTIAVRCGAGGALLLLWVWMRGEWVRPSARSWLTGAVAGTLLFLGCHSVMATVEQRVSSGETALLMTTIPLWMVLVDSIRKRSAPPPLVVVGLLFGAAGVALLTGGAVLSGGSAGDRLALVLCALAWAVGSLVARDGERPASAVQATAMQLLAGAVVVTVAGAFSPASGRWESVHFTPRAAGSLVFLVVCGTALGMAAYTWLLRVASPAAVGTYAFVNPVIALVLGRLVGDDHLGPRALGAAALVVTGVVLIQRAAARPPATILRSDGKPEASATASRPPAPRGHVSVTNSLEARPARLSVRSEA